MKFPLSLLIASLALTLAPVSKAADAVPWYQVEVIVFAQQDLYRTEKHRKDLKLAYPGNWRVLKNSAIGQQQEQQQPSLTGEPADRVETAYVSLGERDFKLGSDGYALKRAPGYRVLLHQAWRQQGLDADQSPWVIVAGGETYGDHSELEGSVRLVLNRYLHFQANLWHTRFGAPVPSATTAYPSQEDSTLQPVDINVVESWPTLPKQPWKNDAAPGSDSADDYGAQQTAPAWSYESPAYAIEDLVALNQTTRLKLGELTYLDHPNMGVLVLVSRYQPGEPP